MSANRSPLVWLGLVALGATLLLVAVLIAIVLFATGPEVVRAPDERQRRRVEVLDARPLTVTRQWRGFGTADAMRSADVPARVSATVTELPETTRAGRAVTRGQMLVRLDASDFERQVEIVTQRLAELDADLAQIDIDRRQRADQLEIERQELQLARKELERVGDIRTRSAASQSDLDHARRDVLVAERAAVATQSQLDGLEPRRRGLAARRAAEQSSLDLARLDRDRCVVRSPLDGVLERVDVEVGENLDRGERVARVVDLARIEIGLRLAASARPYVDVGGDVAIAPAHGNGRDWTGKVARVAPADDSGTRTTTVYVELDQPAGAPGGLVPGMFVEGIVTGRSQTERWVVPRRAVQNGRLLLVDEGRITSRAVTVDFHLERAIDEFGLDDRQWAVLVESLAEGQQVIVSPSRSMRDGQYVEPVGGVARAAKKPRMNTDER
ncbi:MAG: hypothetical protein CMJ18_25040 [Phycisphaeraceae bacterium]|nr:hypothetical protein [Phycisphaeraceae bacterium]